MKWMRVMQAALLGIVLAAVLAEEAIYGHYPLMLSTIALTFLAISVGFSNGIEWILRSTKDRSVSCIGGPLDGREIPRPPGWENRFAEITLGVEDHPSGVYHREGDRLVWFED